MLKVIDVIYLQCVIVSHINRFPAFVCFLHPLEKRKIEVLLYFTNIKVKESRNSVAQRVPGGLGSQIS